MRKLLQLYCETKIIATSIDINHLWNGLKSDRVDAPQRQPFVRIWINTRR